MEVQVITLFPGEFRPLVDLGVTGRAIREGLVNLELVNPRDFAVDRHRSVDDRPYGGGGGMAVEYEVCNPGSKAPGISQACRRGKRDRQFA
jgi:tRNA (guanine-N1)-methyltransferase